MDDFMEKSTNQFAERIAQWRERMMLHLIETNWQKIATNGIDPDSLHNLSQKELNNLQETLQIMLQHYQAIEEYEKCQVIHDHAARIKLMQSLNI